MFIIKIEQQNKGDFNNFPKISEHFPKILEDVRRLPKEVEYFREIFEDVSIINQSINQSIKNFINVSNVE